MLQQTVYTGDGFHIVQEYQPLKINKAKLTAKKTEEVLIDVIEDFDEHIKRLEIVNEPPAQRSKIPENIKVNVIRR